MNHGDDDSGGAAAYLTAILFVFAVHSTNFHHHPNKPKY